MISYHQFGGNDFSRQGINQLDTLSFFAIPVHKILLTSNENSVNGKKAHLQAKFNPSLKLDIHRKHFIQLMFLRVPMTVPNIKAEFKNNTFYYRKVQKSDPEIYTEHYLVMPDGVYTVELINAFIISQMTQIGDATPDSDPPYLPLELYANQATGRAVMIMTEELDYTYEFDFGHDGSLLYQTLGFQSGLLTETTAGITDVDIYGNNSTFFVRCNLVSNLRGGEEDTILFTSDWTGEPWGSQSHIDQFIHPINDMYYKEISEINVRITNINNELMDFTGTAKDSNVICNLLIIK